MSAFFQDLRHAVRRLGKSPVFTLFAAAILTVGIGLNAVAFGMVDALLLRPAPFAHPESLVRIYQDSDEGIPTSTAFPAYRDMAAMVDVFAGVAATSGDRAALETADGPREVDVEYATASYFPVLGVSVARGRWFTAEQDRVGAEPEAVLSDRAWRERFAADPEITGRTIRLNNRPVVIVGVGPPDLNGAGGALLVDLWLSISSAPVGGAYRVANLEQRESHWYDVVGRLAPGVTLERARAAMQALAAQFAETYPAIDKGRNITVFAYNEIRVHPQADAALLAGGIVSFVVAGAVLLLACSNLANLLLVRGLARAPEIAVRAALGGSRLRIARPLLLEALLLAALGGLGGLVAALWAEHALAGMALIPTFGAPDLRFDRRLLAFGAVAAVATGLLCGVLPAVRATKTLALRESDRLHVGMRGTLLRGGLVAVQVALAVVLVVATALLTRSFVNAAHVDPGVDVDRLAVVGTNLEQAGVAPGDDATVSTAILERVAALPGVDRAAFTIRLPLSPGPSTTTIIEGYAPRAGTGAVELPLAAVSRDYFATMGIDVVAGREFNADDRPNGRPVVIVNETAARLFWNGDAVGRRLRPQSSPDGWREVVGVVADSKVNALSEAPTPMLYWSAEQVGVNGFAVVARTSGSAAAVAAALPRALKAVRESLPITRPATPFTAQIHAALASARSAASIMGAFSVLALTLAGLGVYAAVSFAVERRSHEIGIRVALGATRTRLVTMVVGESLAVAGIGVVAGLGLALLAAQSLRSMLFGVPPADSASFASAAALLVAAAVRRRARACAARRAREPVGRIARAVAGASSAYCDTLRSQHWGAADSLAP